MDMNGLLEMIACGIALLAAIQNGKNGPTDYCRKVEFKSPSRRLSF